MQLFKYSQDRLPVALFAAYFLCDLVVYARARGVAVLLAWFLLGILPKAWICAWNHNHQHVPPFRHALLNRLLTLMYGFQTGAITNLWVLHHVLGHHRHYLDPRRDQNRWRRVDGTPMSLLEYTVNITVTSYPRALRVGRKFRRQRRVLLLSGLLTLLMLGAALYCRPMPALFVFVLPMALSLVLTGMNTYYQHFGLATRDPLAASYNVTHRWFNILTGNMGYHTAHHFRPGVHWSRLPALHRSLEGRIPRELLLKAGAPYSWLGPD